MVGAMTGAATVEPLVVHLAPAGRRPPHTVYASPNPMPKESV
jgi:hypothetical protein